MSAVRRDSSRVRIMASLEQSLLNLNTDHVDRPTHHRCGILVEPFKDLGIRACAVVIADEGQPAALRHFIHAAFRVASIAHDVAETEGLVHRWAVA